MSGEFLEEDKVKRQMGLGELIYKLVPYFKRHKKSFFFIIFVVLIFSAVGRSIPLLFGYAIDEGIKKQALEVVYWVAGLYLIFELLRSFLAFAQEYKMLKLANRILFEIRERVIHHVQSLPVQFFDKNPIGRTVTRITNDIVSLGDLFNQGLTAFFINFVEIATILVALFALNAPLTLVVLFIVPLTIYFTIGITKKIRAHFQEAKKRISKINSFTAENINGMKIVQLYDRVNAHYDEFVEHSKSYKEAQLGTVRQFALLWPVFSFFRIGSIVATLLVAALFYDKLGLTVGTLSAFLLLVQSFFKPIRVILERYNQFQNALASADRIFTLLANEPEPLKGRRLPSRKLDGEIEFKNISFRYSNDGPYVLSDINLKIKPGQSVALVGRTGSGKTTMISLLQKFYNYEEGEILIDGSSIRDLAPRELRERIGVIQQDNFIFRGNILENIRLEDDTISLEQVKEAAKKANCEPMLSRHKGGLEASVDERGGNLSVGEKQLIAFARALAFDPDILVLDEATANIDSENEQYIQKAMKEVTQGRTSLIIAHRLSTILDCDLIAVLSKGRIIEQGTHSELMGLKGAYHELYESQFKKADADNFARLPDVE